ncbi:hypothetical protein BT63DRAFT_331236 [Microthyrium microscopicum]|uniref:LITAF domain-containing protein n=1 Tax=Microthyrium microscopicum TaxID=703497 RepID=A0A6A6U6F2_9PEZI|nr:hypothetical protein BT63DRAFT_331236 [Microthyrium microscopicum]
MFNQPVEEVVQLLPCVICSAPFDPSTLPSHVYDPYQTFLLFTHHSSICPSCFAEELAKRTQPHPTSGQSSRPMKMNYESPIYDHDMMARNDSTTTFVSEHASMHRKASSISTIPRSASTPIGSETRSVHRKASSVTTFSRPGSQREYKSADPLRRQPSINHSRKSQETYRARPSTSTGYNSTSSQKNSPELLQRSQSQRASPDLSVPNQLDRPASRATSALEPPRKSGDNVRRKVSFRHNTPTAIYNPLSPLRPPTPTVPPLPEQLMVMPRTPDVPPPSSASGAPAPPAIRLSPEPRPRASNRRQESPPSSTISWTSWRTRRQQEKDAREQRWQLRKEKQRQRKEREDADKGIGLYLFCPECRVVVKTTPKWKNGSCCFLYSTCLFLCTGPLSLSLLLPCASTQIRDVHSHCPNCSTTLSTWSRRKNQLTVLTWAGAPPTMPPSGQAHTGPAHPRPTTTPIRLPSSHLPSSTSNSRPRTAIPPRTSSARSHRTHPQPITNHTTHPQALPPPNRAHHAPTPSNGTTTTTTERTSASSLPSSLPQSTSAATGTTQRTRSSTLVGSSSGTSGNSPPRDTRSFGGGSSFEREGVRATDFAVEEVEERVVDLDIIELTEVGRAIG